MSKKLDKVLVIPDIHAPFMIINGAEFAYEIYKKERCTQVVFLGDIFENHRISRHPKSPEAMGGKEEYRKALKELVKLYKMFPKVKACIGNHDERYYRGLGDLGYCEEMMKTLPELAQSPTGWDWKLRHVIDKVLYIHGTAYSGETPQKTAMEKNAMSVVLGHIHTAAGIIWKATPNQLMFGMACGCLMDAESYAADYAKLQDKKPIVGVGIVEDGILPKYFPMPLGKNGLFEQMR